MIVSWTLQKLFEWLIRIFIISGSLFHPLFDSLLTKLSRSIYHLLIFRLIYSVFVSKNFAFGLSATLWLFELNTRLDNHDFWGNGVVWFDDLCSLVCLMVFSLEFGFVFFWKVFVCKVKYFNWFLYCHGRLLLWGENWSFVLNVIDRRDRFLISTMFRIQKSLHKRITLNTIPHVLLHFLDFRPFKNNRVSLQIKSHSFISSRNLREKSLDIICLSPLRHTLHHPLNLLPSLLFQVLFHFLLLFDFLRHN